jgi:hypothetical protein
LIITREISIPIDRIRKETGMSGCETDGAARFGRRAFIGGSDARIIMSSDEAALIRLWREKRGEAEPEDLSGNQSCSSREQPRS